MTQQEGKLSDITIGQPEISVILSALRLYTLYIEASLPLNKRMRALTEILDLRIKIQQLIVQAAREEPITLTVGELEIIDKALEFLITNTRRIIPVSRERDATLKDCEMLQQVIRKRSKSDYH